jgi:acyl-CoA thioesterase FadM
VLSMSKGYIYEHVVTPRDVTDQSLVYDESYVEWACTSRERMIVEHLEARPRFLVGETYIRYMTPAYLYDRIEIRTTVGDTNVEKGRVKLEFRFSNKTTGRMVAEGYQVIFFHDLTTGKRMPVPEAFQKLTELGTDEAV